MSSLFGIVLPDHCRHLQTASNNPKEKDDQCPCRHLYILILCYSVQLTGILERGRRKGVDQSYLGRCQIWCQWIDSHFHEQVKVLFTKTWHVRNGSNTMHLILRLRFIFLQICTLILFSNNWYLRPTPLLLCGKTLYVSKRCIEALFKDIGDHIVCCNEARYWSVVFVLFSLLIIMWYFREPVRRLFRVSKIAGSSCAIRWSAESESM